MTKRRLCRNPETAELRPTSGVCRPQASNCQLVAQRQSAGAELASVMRAFFNTPRILFALCLSALMLPTTGQPLLDHKHHKPTVAIVGAGIGGAFTAHKLRRLLNDTVHVHIFEHSLVGGRVEEFAYNDHEYEAGASILFAKNYYVRDAADQLGLERVPPEGSSEDLFSIWDGSKFVFKSSPWSLVSLWRLISRYWLMYFKFQAPNQMLQKFLRLYDLQSRGQSFETPEAFLKELDLYDLTQQSMQDYLNVDLGRSPAAARFGSEFVAAVNKVNYNQGNTLNALAGMVSMLPTVDNDLFRIKGGNSQVPKQLLQQSNAQLCNATVTGVVKLQGNAYQLKGVDQTQCKGATYSAVVIATPLELTNIEFEGLDLPHLPARKYQSTISTFVRGHLKGSYFGQQKAPQGAVMVSEGADTPFSSLSPAKVFADGTSLYKLFSTKSLDTQTLHAMFANLASIGEFPWLAYPVFHPPEQFAPFKLADGLFYNNAWENAASCMEISAISAINSALLVQKAINISLATPPSVDTSFDVTEL